jgi:hypothetical protein
VNGNFLDQCVLQWGKLFGTTATDKRGAHFWENLVSDKIRFETQMFREIGCEGFGNTFNAIREYRNTFLVHLDEDKIMPIPLLDTARDAVWFYKRHVFNNEAQLGDLEGVPANLEDYYRRCASDAQKAYGI